jgi:hypothetical protein
MKFTTFQLEHQSVFLDLLRSGCPIHEACQRVGVNYDTFYAWMQKGGDPKSHAKGKCLPHVQVEPFWSFARAVRMAQEVGSRQDVPRRHSGRMPNPISDEEQALIIEAIRSGVSYHTACKQAGVKLSRFTSWLRHGGFPRRLTLHPPIPEQDVREPYKSFADAVLAAEEESLGSF